MVANIIIVLALYTATKIINAETEAYLFLMLIRGIMFGDQESIRRGKTACLTGLPLAMALNAELSFLLDQAVLYPAFLALSFFTMWLLAIRVYLHWNLGQM